MLSAASQRNACFIFWHDAIRRSGVFYSLWCRRFHLVLSFRHRTPLIRTSTHWKAIVHKLIILSLIPLCTVSSGESEMWNEHPHPSSNQAYHHNAVRSFCLYYLLNNNNDIIRKRKTLSYRSSLVKCFLQRFHFGLKKLTCTTTVY